MNSSQPYLTLEECKVRVIYRLASRNLTCGVYNGVSGFIGIRTKFDHRFLDTEFHYDTGEPYGTAKPLEQVGVLPEWIPVSSELGTICQGCGNTVIAIPLEDGSRYVRWEHVPWRCKDGEGKLIPYDHSSCLEIRPISLGNRYLFNYLDDLGKNDLI